MIGILLLGLVLRCAPLDRNRTMEDEALYSYWALQIATGSDPMLAREQVDKPPLFPYTLGLSFALLGPRHALLLGSGAAPGHDMQAIGTPMACATSGCRAEVSQLELVSRLPNLFASTATIALSYALGSKLYESRKTGLLAALLTALSPFAILFSPTTFVDPYLTVWVLSALLAAGTGQIGSAGLLAGLAASSKQQGLLFLPLVIALGILSSQSQERAPQLLSPPGRLRLLLRERRWLQWALFTLGFAAVLLSTAAWDQARGKRPGFFAQSIVSYGGFRLAPLQDLTERATSWLELLGGFWTSPGLNGLLLGALLAWSAGGLVAALRRSRHKTPIATRSDPASRARAISAALLLFVVAFLVMHWLFEIQPWDRYLLVVLPLVSLLASRALRFVRHSLPRGRWQAAFAPGLAAVLAVGLAGPLAGAMRDELAVGGDHGAYDGIDDLAAYARQNLPPGSVLYDHWLGYHYRFYLYGAPLHVHWYPDLLDLVRDAQEYRRVSRYIAFPSWRDGLPAATALAHAGIQLAPLTETLRRDGSVSFRLYRLVGP